MALLRLCISFSSDVPGSIIITSIRHLCLTNLLSLDFKIALISSLNVTPESCHSMSITAYSLSQFFLIFSNNAFLWCCLLFVISWLSFWYSVLPAVLCLRLSFSLFQTSIKEQIHGFLFTDKDYSVIKYCGCCRLINRLIWHTAFINFS